MASRQIIVIKDNMMAIRVNIRCTCFAYNRENVKYRDKKILANRAVQNQTAPEGAV